MESKKETSKVSSDKILKANMDLLAEAFKLNILSQLFENTNNMEYEDVLWLLEVMRQFNYVAEKIALKMLDKHDTEKQGTH